MKEIGQNLNKKTLTGLFHKDWADLLQIDQQNVNLPMYTFLNKMDSILDTHAPLK